MFLYTSPYETKKTLAAHPLNDGLSACDQPFGLPR